MYRNLERPLQFSEDIWNAFYQSEVQLKVARQLKEITEHLAKAKKAREFGRSDRDLKALELKLIECQSVVDEVGDPPLKFLKATERMKMVSKHHPQARARWHSRPQSSICKYPKPSPPFLSCKDSHACEFLSSQTGLFAIPLQCDTFAIPL